MLQKYILQLCCVVIYLFLLMKLQINWDSLGAATSIACAIHCAILPLVITSLPLFGFNIINNNFFEAGMITLAFVIGSLALYHGFKRHHQRILPILVFTAGFMFLVSKQIFLDYEILLLVPAVTLILGAHFLNYRLCRKSDHRHSDDCNHTIK